MDEVLGRRLRTLRRRRGLSQETLAHLAGKSERWLRDVEAGTVGLWVRDALHMAELLKVDVAELIGAADPRQSESAAPDAESLASALDGNTHVDLKLASSLGAAARRLPSQLAALSCRTLLQLAHANLLSFRILLDEPMPGAVKRELAAGAAETGVLAGMLCIALGQGERADGYFRHAAMLAATAGDSVTRSRALLYNSQLYSRAFMDGRKEDPVRSRELLDGAARHAGRTGAIRALCLMRQAMERAVVHEERAAYSLLDGADRALAAAPERGRAAPWWWHRSFPPAFRGKAAMLAGRPRQAIPLLEDVLGMFDSSMANRSRMIADLGATYAQLGEIEQACALLSQALELDREAGLVGSMPRTRAIRNRELRRHAAEPAVRRLDEQFRETAGASSIMSESATASVSVTVGAWDGRSIKAS
jgi:transcriptional regulator with XRE-family HTH domain